MARYSREEQAARWSAAQALGESGGANSERRQAAQLNVARTTLQHWRRRREAIEAPAAEVAFFESPEGIALLHRLVIGAHFVITLLGCGGVRLVCQFLELTGLSAFIGASYGSQQQVNAALEAAVVAYAEQQRRSLGATMASRTISVCEDETYHPAICLVGLEPVSNFLLLERYAKDRSADTWTQALEEAFAGLPVKVIQATSDEAKGICRHVKSDLGAHHAPDLFHVQHEVAKATALNLNRAVKQAEQTLADAQHEQARVQQAQRDSEQSAKRPRRRPAAFQRRLDSLHRQCEAAQQRLEQARSHRDEAHAQLRELSAAYHPYDLHTAEAQSSERLAERLQNAWVKLNQIACEAKLPERARQSLRKAQRMSAHLLATVTFFFATVQAKVEALNLPLDIETAVYQQLIRAIYLDRVADKTTDTAQRQSLRQQVATLLTPLHQPDHPFSGLDDDERRVVESVAVECADLFQRSSSAVEGRNGQLALHHHARHRLSDRKLAALTAVHNYFIERPDGTTAAERFFGRRPDKLFGWLLEKVALPGRPARKRPRPTKPSYLQPVAA